MRDDRKIAYTKKTRIEEKHRMLVPFSLFFMFLRERGYTLPENELRICVRTDVFEDNDGDLVVTWNDSRDEEESL